VGSLVSGLIDQARREVIQPPFESRYFLMVASLDGDDRETLRNVGVWVDDGLVQVFCVASPAAASEIRAESRASGSNLVTASTIAFPPEQLLARSGIASEHGGDRG